MTSEFAKLPETGLVRLSVIRKVIPLAKSTIWKRVRTGEFPRPLKIGRATLWRVEDIRALLDKLGGE